jgi:hypothetical protein
MESYSLLNIDEKDEEYDELVEYLNTLSPNERKAIEIASIQLKTSFNLKTSIGYLEYLKNKS